MARGLISAAKTPQAVVVWACVASYAQVFANHARCGSTLYIVIPLISFG
jgi:hypothetical protein